MSKGITEYTALGKERFTAGETPDKIASWLHAEGLDVVSAVKCIRSIFDVKLGAVRAFLVSHRDWSQYVVSENELILTKESSEHTMSKEEYDSIYPQILYPGQNFSFEDGGSCQD